MQDIAEVNHMIWDLHELLCEDLVHGLVPVCHSGNETAEAVDVLLQVVGDMGPNHLTDLGLDPAKARHKLEGLVSARCRVDRGLRPKSLTCVRLRVPNAEPMAA
jgi:hypothetical protein